MTFKDNKKNASKSNLWWKKVCLHCIPYKVHEIDFITRATDTMRKDTTLVPITFS